MALAKDKLAIETVDLKIRFGEQLILDRINLQVFEGESLVVVGPSGQGKSVLLKLLAGLISPTSGKVLVRGQEWAVLSGTRRQEVVQRLGMLFQKNAIFDSLTVAENVAFPLRELTNLSEGEIAKEVEFYLDSVGLLHAKELFPDEISGGMQKRLGIARALVLKPEVIFYDDPTAGLDPITSRKIIELILKLKRDQNSTIITITNDMNRAYQMADRIVVVVDHQVLVTGTAEETKANADPRVYQFIRGLLAGPLTSQEELV